MLPGLLVSHSSRRLHPNRCTCPSSFPFQTIHTPYSIPTQPLPSSLEISPYYHLLTSKSPAHSPCCLLFCSQANKDEPKKLDECPKRWKRWRGERKIGDVLRQGLII